MLPNVGQSSLFYKVMNYEECNVSLRVCVCMYVCLFVWVCVCMCVHEHAWEAHL